MAREARSSLMIKLTQTFLVAILKFSFCQEKRTSGSTGAASSKTARFSGSSFASLAA